jgi:hypothetical protein
MTARVLYNYTHLAIESVFNCVTNDVNQYLAYPILILKNNYRHGLFYLHYKEQIFLKRHWLKNIFEFF